jgi:hypothetical protein
VGEDDGGKKIEHMKEKRKLKQSSILLAGRKNSLVGKDATIHENNIVEPTKKENNSRRFSIRDMFSSLTFQKSKYVIPDAVQDENHLDIPKDLVHNKLPHEIQNGNQDIQHNKNVDSKQTNSQYNQNQIENDYRDNPQKDKDEDEDKSKIQEKEQKVIFQKQLNFQEK